MKLQLENPNEILIPTLDIIYVWISHIIRPELFEEDTEKNFGGKKMFFKLESTLNQVLALTKKKLLYATKLLYENTYKVPYLNVEVFDEPNQTNLIKFYFEHIYTLSPLDFSSCDHLENPLLLRENDLLKDYQWFHNFKHVEKSFDFVYNLQLEKSYELFLYECGKWFLSNDPNKEVVRPTYLVDSVKLFFFFFFSFKILPFSFSRCGTLT